MTLQDTWSVPGIIGTGVKANDAYVDGSFFLTVPAWSSIGRDGWLEGDVIFLEPYTSWGEQGEVVASLGLGWRHLFSQQGVGAILQHDGHQAGFLEEGGFVGANLFVDMLDTQFDNRFWQLGFGLEAGARYLEARANYYLPLSDRQEAEEIRTRQSIQQYSTLTEYDEPFATGHTIQQDVSVSTLQTTTTIERLFRRYEDGMEGWDAEVALLLPWVDRWMDVKVIGGYYAFDNQPFGPQAGGTGNVEGWKAGIEVRPVPAVALHATWYEDERLVGSDWLAGVRLEIPFEAGDLGDGKGFWDRVGDAFRPRRRHLAERMAEPVRRQNAAIKIASSVEEDKSEAEVKVVTRVVAQDRNRVVLADTVVFADNSIGSDANPGTYEQPKATVTNSENTAEQLFGQQGIVFVQGGGPSYAESVTVTSSMGFYGSGRGIAGLGGRVFHGRNSATPSILGFNADHIGALTISGFEVTDTSGNNIGISDVGKVILVGNYIHDIAANYGFIIVTTGSTVSTAYVLDNIVTATGGTILQSLDSSQLTTYMSGNYLANISGNSSVLQVQTSGSSQQRLIAEGNVFKGAPNYGIIITTADTSRMSASLINNQMSDIATGISAETEDASVVNLHLVGNNFVNNTNTPVSLLALDDSRQTVYIEGNVFYAGANGSFYALTGGTSKLNLVARGNAFIDRSSLGYGGTGLSASVDSTINAVFLDNYFGGYFNGGSDTNGILNLTAVGNTFRGTSVFGADALAINAAGSGSTTLIASSNRIINGGGNGVGLLDDGMGTVTATINGNTISGSVGDGIHIDFSNPASTVTGTINNSVTGSTGNSLEVVNGPVSFQIRLNGTLITPLTTTP